MWYSEFASVNKESFPIVLHVQNGWTIVLEDFSHQRNNFNSSWDKYSLLLLCHSVRHLDAVKENNNSCRPGINTRKNNIVKRQRNIEIN